MNMEKRDYLIITVIGVAILGVILSLTLSIKTDADLECGIEMAKKGELCPHSSFFPLESYIGITLSLVMIAYGGYKYFTSKKTSIKPKIDVNKLKEEEKKIYLLLLENEGMLFQNEIVKITGLSKVKITRILDKLEAKNLIIRRRRGMTNIVIVKHE